jgi:hypothetical protein
MKKLIAPVMVSLSAMTLLTGCIIGDRSNTTRVMPTVGQQLTDLQKAKDAGAITDEQYQAQKAKILDEKVKP